MTRMSRLGSLVLALAFAGGGVLQAQSLVTSPMPLIGITPCRIVDTRDAGFPPGYGPPALVAGAFPRAASPWRASAASRRGRRRSP